MCITTGLSGFGDFQFVYMDAQVLDNSGVGNRSFSETPDFAGEFDPGPGKPSPESGVSLEVPGFACDFGVLQILDFACAIDPWPRKSGDVLAMPDFINNFNPGPAGQHLQIYILHIITSDILSWDTIKGITCDLLNLFTRYFYMCSI